jgi:hypothetical protein
MVRTKSWQCDLQNLRVWTKCIWCEQKFQECDKYLNGVNKIMTVWSKKKMVWTKNLMVWTKISMVWTKCIRCDETIWWCDQKIWRCDQNLDGVIKTFLVWSNVHLLEIVWSHRVVWSFHMFFSDGSPPFERMDGLPRSLGACGCALGHTDGLSLDHRQTARSCGPTCARCCGHMHHRRAQSTRATARRRNAKGRNDQRVCIFVLCCRGFSWGF